MPINYRDLSLLLQQADFHEIQIQTLENKLEQAHVRYDLAVKTARGYLSEERYLQKQISSKSSRAAKLASELTQLERSLVDLNAMENGLKCEIRGLQMSLNEMEIRVGIEKRGVEEITRSLDEIRASLESVTEADTEPETVKELGKHELCFPTKLEECIRWEREEHKKVYEDCRKREKEALKAVEDAKTLLRQALARLDEETSYRRKKQTSRHQFGFLRALSWSRCA